MESVLAVRDKYQMQNWAKIIGERQESGLTVKDYCALSAYPAYIDKTTFITNCNNCKIYENSAGKPKSTFLR